jgi:hypothetical protein
MQSSETPAWTTAADLTGLVTCSGRSHRIKMDSALNLPFSEWTQVIPNARLCKALLDRITDRAHIVETGADSFRFRRTVEKGRPKPTG